MNRSIVALALRSPLFALLLFALLLLGPLYAQDAAPHPTARLLQEVIAIDTSNPPGNEGKLAEFLATRFKPLGFEVDIVPTPEPGKAHFIARLRGNGSKKPVLLAAHADVVGVEREKWTMDPFGGTIKDGYLYGRGAIDYKGGVAVFARAVMMLAENKVPLDRDVILLVEADEEGGRYNTSWLAEDHWDKIDCEFALNEGGWIMMNDEGKVDYVSISTADKSSVSLLITARGTSTHSAMPLPDNPIFRLSTAMAKLANYQTKPFLIPSTRQFFSVLARTSPAHMRPHYHNLVNSSDPAEIAAADAAIRDYSPLHHALIRNTIAPVFLNAGFRGNVIPGHASATVNFRIIPGTDPEELRREIEKVVAGDGIEVTYASFVNLTPEQMEARRRRMLGMKPSSETTELYQSLFRRAQETYPEAEVTPYLFNAGTDAIAWRLRGVPVYGIYPYPITDTDLMRMHGNDERVPVASLISGTDMIYKVLLDVAASK
jgi:acetylornithine deacetylase/succinyl-diaminopimelate desuccinylase-like protein